jgi:GNAT superfamily N-acetyltransferase
MTVFKRTIGETMRRMSGGSVRVAAPDDEPFLCEMLYQALSVPPGGPPHARSALERPEIAHYVEAFGTRRGDDGLVATTTLGEPVGAVWVRLLDQADPGYGYVDDDTPELTMAVVGEHRGLGIGSELLRLLLQRVPACSLSVDPQNPARRLYERFGFEAVGWCETSLTMVRSRST